MKLFKVKMAAVGASAVLCAALLAVAFVAPDAVGAVSFGHVASSFDLGDLDFIMAAPALAALRTSLGDLERRAKDKLGEVKDDTPDADVRRIEGEHADLLTEIDEVRAKITKAEKDEAAAGHSGAAGADEVRAAERRRISEIRGAVRDFGFTDTEADAFIDGGHDINEVRAALQRKLADKSRRETPPAGGHRVQTGGQDERETRVALMTNALEHRLNPTVELQDGARQYRGMRMLDMARDCLEAEGVTVRGMTPMEIAEMALSGGSSQLAQRAGMHTTSDFPIVLGSQINTTLRRAYMAAPRTYRRIATRQTATDFRPIIRAQIGDNPRLLKVNEHGEFARGTIGEGKEQYQLETFGRVIGVTRRVLVNDQLDALTRVPRAWGVAAAALEDEIVWSLVTANANMEDGNALFSSAHGNLAGSGAVISVATVGAGRHAMRQQRTLEPGGKKGEVGYRLSVEANLLVVPSALETAALQFLSSELVPASATDVNPFRRSLEPLVVPLLDDDSAKAWYLFAEPAKSGIDTIEYAYLDGQDGVYTDTRIGFDVDGVEWKARLDFGAGVIDHRGMYKNAGPA